MNNGTRIVVTRIQVDPDDPKECEHGCPGFLSWDGDNKKPTGPYCRLFCYVRIRNFKRIPACLAAEVKVDEKAGDFSRDYMTDEDWPDKWEEYGWYEVPADTIHDPVELLARANLAHLALMKVIE